MPKYIDMTGARYGKLTVIMRADDAPSGQKRWLCRCDCGKETIVHGQSLRSGHTVSCGCYRKAINAEMGKQKLTKHGGARTRLYRIWKGMKQRCRDENSTRYQSYGGRGISVCEEWIDDFSAFQEWALKNGYQDDLTIDRKDTNGNYEPSNCQWISNKDQQANKRNNRVIECNGDIHTLSEWSKITGVKEGTIAYRLKAGWPIEKALKEPVEE